MSEKPSQVAVFAPDLRVIGYFDQPFTLQVPAHRGTAVRQYETIKPGDQICGVVSAIVGGWAHVTGGPIDPETGRLRGPALSLKIRCPILTPNITRNISPKGGVVINLNLVNLEIFDRCTLMEEV